jgi:hypothetical protein
MVGWLRPSRGRESVDRRAMGSPKARPPCATRSRPGRWAAGPPCAPATACARFVSRLAYGVTRGPYPIAHLPPPSRQPTPGPTPVASRRLAAGQSAPRRFSLPGDGHFVWPLAGGRRGVRAASQRSSTHCGRPRWRVARLPPTASAMASSAERLPSGLASACNTRRPWSNVRAAPWPDDPIVRRTQRSSSVRVTRHVAMGELLLLKPQSVARRRTDLAQPVNRRLPSY